MRKKRINVILWYISFSIKDDNNNNEDFRNFRYPAHGVMFIVIGNGPSDSSSNPGQGCWHVTKH